MVLTPLLRSGTCPTRNFARLLSLRFRRSRTLSFPTAIHADGDGLDLRHAVRREVLPPLHEQEDSAELEEVHAFLRLEGMLLEERDHALAQKRRLPNPVAHPVGMVPSNHAAAEESLERIQHLHIALVLDHREFRQHLEAGLHLRVRVDADEETSLAVDEPGYPLRFQPAVRCR